MAFVEVFRRDDKRYLTAMRHVLKFVGRLSGFIIALSFLGLCFFNFIWLRLDLVLRPECRSFLHNITLSVCEFSYSPISAFSPVGELLFFSLFPSVGVVEGVNLFERRFIFTQVYIKVFSEGQS